MNISDWITLAAVLVALGLGVSSLIQTQMLQKRERGERLLNEIIEWAIDVAKSAVSRQTMAKTELWKTKLEYKYSKAKNKYITEVVSSSFNELSSSVRSVTTELDNAIDATMQFIENQKRPGDKLVNYESKLTESVAELITEIGKIKTKGISAS